METQKDILQSPLCPGHWYCSVCKASLAIGLSESLYSPCLFSGEIIPGQPPLQIGIYVDDFVYYSQSDVVRIHFEQPLAQHVKVGFLGQCEYFLGQSFHWTYADNNLDVHISQASFNQHFIDKFKLTDCKFDHTMTPYRSSLLVDAIQPKHLQHEDQETLNKRYQSIVGHLNWLAMFTCQDIAPSISFLASYNQAPTVHHFDAAHYVVQYL